MLGHYFIAIVFASAALADTLAGGVKPCGVEISDEWKVAAEKELQSKLSQSQAEGHVLASAANKAFQVYWNVISKDGTTGGGNLSDATIANQMTVLNDDFSGTNITFNLVNTTRMVNALWFNTVGPGNALQDQMKAQLHKGGSSTLNIYSVGLINGPYAGGTGYATFPRDYKNKMLDDGVVLNHKTLPGGPLQDYSEGRILTHEVGHWLGLYHTFENGCYGSGDEVADTPAEADAAYGCPVGRDTCLSTGKDPIHNHMDYTRDSCKDNFTSGQKARMAMQISMFRT